MHDYLLLLLVPMPNHSLKDCRKMPNTCLVDSSPSIRSWSFSSTAEVTYRPIVPEDELLLLVVSFLWQHKDGGEVYMIREWMRCFIDTNHLSMFISFVQATPTSSRNCSSFSTKYCMQLNLTWMQKYGRQIHIKYISAKFLKWNLCNSPKLSICFPMSVCSSYVKLSSFSFAHVFPVIKHKTVHHT